jgi:hypothetical protein
VKHHSRAVFFPLKVLVAATAGALALSAADSQARVTKVVVDQTADLNSAGQNIAYEQVSGRAFGELDPAHPLNAIIQDIDLAKDADGKVRYVASFVLTKPKNMSQASGMIVARRAQPRLADRDQRDRAQLRRHRASPARGRGTTPPSTPTTAPRCARRCSWAAAIG